MRICLVGNPVAGSGAPARIERAALLLREMGAEVDLAMTTAAGDAEHWAAEAAASGRFDRLLVAGGDGTLNEVSNGLAGSDLPLALLPLGTTNVFALEAGIPDDLVAACRLAKEGQVAAVHSGLAGKRHFLLMAGVGFDAETVRRVSPVLKRRLGKGAYLASGLCAMAVNSSFPLRIRTEQGSYEGHGAIISNCRHYGGPFSITPSASMFNATFEVCLFRAWNRTILLKHALNLARHRPLDDRFVKIFTCRELRIESPAIPIQLDGDFFCTTPETFAMAPHCLQVVLPARN